jgi:hypothetical protein
MNDWAALAGVLLEAMGDHVAEQGRPTWVRVLDTPGEPPLQGFSVALADDPDGLVGWLATDDCQAVGVIATGRLRPIERVPVGAADPSRNDVRMACLVTRQDEVAWKMLLPNGTTSSQPPAEGRLLDCLRRCFGLPTSPPPVGPGQLQVVAWLATLLDHAAEAQRPLNWSEVSRLHPVARFLRSELEGGCSEVVPGLMRMAASAWSWEDVRLQVQHHGGLADIIDPELAGWMDQGMFARWILSDLPSPDELLATLRPQLAPSAARRLTHAVRTAGSLEPARASG